jgi:hypothetical protein
LGISHIALCLGTGVSHIVLHLGWCFGLVASGEREARGRY